MIVSWPVVWMEACAHWMNCRNPSVASARVSGVETIAEVINVNLYQNAVRKRVTEQENIVNITYFCSKTKNILFIICFDDEEKNMIFFHAVTCMNPSESVNQSNYQLGQRKFSNTSAQNPPPACSTQYSMNIWLKGSCPPWLSCNLEARVSKRVFKRLTSFRYQQLCR